MGDELQDNPFNELRPNPYSDGEGNTLSETQNETRFDTEHDVESTTRNVKQWYMIVMEDSGIFNVGDRISGQFTPQQVVQNIGAKIVEGGGFSRTSPIIQWAGGQLRSVSMNVRLFSEHKDDHTAEAKLNQLERLVDEYHRLTNRPPLVSFFWGIAFPDGIPCFIESLGNIAYDEIREDGSIRGVTLNVTLKRHQRYIVEQTTLPEVEQTPAHVVKDGETYEMIAYRRYGDPLLGVLLRQMNPRSPMTAQFPAQVADLQAGERVKLYPKNQLNRERIRPLCHLLRQDSYITADNRRYFFELRSKEMTAFPRK